MRRRRIPSTSSIVVSATHLPPVLKRAQESPLRRRSSTPAMGRPRSRKRTRPRDGDDQEAAGEELETGMFPVGALVEVRIDDQGFEGSFYEATVEAHLPGAGGRAASRYVVAYATLMRREDGASPHHERVHAADVRPRPPPPASAARRDGFAVHDKVEAFHNEGWWAGVVVRRLDAETEEGGGEEAGTTRRRVYTVCFPTTREVLDFDEARLRPRLVFLRHRWVPAAEAQNRRPMFGEGSQVEVSRSPKNFGQHWSPATVLKVIDATSFLVQYGDIGENGELVTEIMDAQYIRPARDNIRMDSKYRYPPSSFVEVFYEGSWWPGVILEVLDDKSVKKYVVKIKSHGTAMDNVECVDVLTVEHTHLRPRFDWHDGKWVRCLTEKQFNRGPQSTSAKRKISSTIQSSNDIDNTAASVSSIDSDEITHESSFSVKKKKTNAVLEGPDLSMCNENIRIKQQLTSYPEETGKQQNLVLALSSPVFLPSQLPVSGFGCLKYDPKLFLSNQYQLPCTRMIPMPSVPQTGHLQASLFGEFGQLRPLPQGPVLGIESLNPDFSSIGGTRKAFTVQENQPTDKGYYLTADPQQKNNAKKSNVGWPVGTALYKKRKECISSQTLVELAENPEIVLRKKRTVHKNAEGSSQDVSSSEERLKTKNDYNKDLLRDTTHHSEILSEIDTVASIESTPLKGNKGSEERSVFLRESNVVDEIIPSGIPIGTDEFHHGGYTGMLRVGAAKVSILGEHAVRSVITLDKPCDAGVLLSDPLTQHRNNATETEISEISIEQEAVEEFCQQVLVVPDDDSVDLLPSGESCEVARNDDQLHKDNASDMVQWDTYCSVPSDMALAVSSDLVVVGSLGNRGGLPSIIPETVKDNSIKQSHENGVPHLDCISPMVEFVAECSQSTDKSALTQLSSTDMNNSTEPEHGNRLLIEPKDSEGTPVSKYVPSRIQDCRCPILQRSLAVHKSILADKPSESLAVENLSFVKTSPMWAQVAAMEIFSKMPQRPNFDQFQQHVPEVQEGMALGLMLSFANLAESIKQLNIQDENALFEEKMKGLSSLEAHGFDVTHLRSHLETLLDIKNHRAELYDAIKKVEEKIAHEESVDWQLGAQIGMLNSNIRQLDLHAHLLRAITQSFVSQKINCGVKISGLKAEAGELKHSYLSAEERFSQRVMAPW